MTRWRVLFFGTPEIASVCLQALTEDARFEIKLVVTQPDRPAGRGAKITSSPVKTFADSNSFPIHQPLRIKSNIAETIEALEKHGPYDIGIVVAFGQILPLEVLQYPVHGCINIHASLLPRWRGAAPIQRAILAGDKETGVALMQMDSGLDTGSVFCEERVSIEDFDNFQTLHTKLCLASSIILKRDLVPILEGKIKSHAQNSIGLEYAKKITVEEAKILWSELGENIVRKIRAFSPFPGAFTNYRGKRLKIYRARAYKQKTNPSDFGKIVFVDKTRLDVGCADGLVSLEDVQLEGKNRLSISDFLRGQSFDSSIKLGEN